ncbi:MAG: hypothetical protein ACR2O4_12125, partial [Hyphomicrobiaceae bacterium]
TRISGEAGASQKRLVEISQEIARLDVAKTEASQRQAVLTQSGQNDLAADLDAAGGIRALEIARDKFRRAPAVQGFERLEQLCTSLLANLRSVPSLRTATTAVNCEPGNASILANRVFRLNAAEEAFQKTCVAGDFPRTSTNKFLAFGSSCIQGSGLPGTDTEQFRDQLNRIALNRDDKAHRFVVSWNAFNDGNALAYLALAIAIAIDGLVFMSGLFGANVIRSPLSSVSEERLINTIDKALGGDKYAAAQRTLKAIADNPDAGFGSFRHQVPLSVAVEDPIIQKVLTAGKGLNAVRWDDRTKRYLVHSDFNTYLNQVAMRTVDGSDELRKVLRDALAPDIAENAADVMHEIQPVSLRDGFMGYVTKSADTPKGGSTDILRRALSAGTSIGVIKTSEKVAQNNVDKITYWVRPSFWACLADLRANEKSSTSRAKRRSMRDVEPTYASDQTAHPLPPAIQTAQAPPTPIPQVAELVAEKQPRSAQIYPASAINLEEQNRESVIRRNVREALADQFGLSPELASHVFGDSYIAVDTLHGLKQLSGALATSLVSEIENAADRVRAESEGMVNGYEDDERLIAEEERDTIALAEAARRTSQMWRETAATLLERFHDFEDFSNDDGTFPNRAMETTTELNRLKEQVINLQSHDRFDSELVTLVSDADKAWPQLERFITAQREQKFRALN